MLGERDQRGFRAEARRVSFLLLKETDSIDGRQTGDSFHAAENLGPVFYNESKPGLALIGKQRVRSSRRWTSVAQPFVIERHDPAHYDPFSSTFSS